jgi:hypothetical protein
MHYLFPYYGSPSCRTIVISDSEYQALQRAEAQDYITSLEGKIYSYEKEIEKLRSNILKVSKQAGLLPESKHDQPSETSETIREGGTSNITEEST